MTLKRSYLTKRNATRGKLLNLKGIMFVQNPETTALNILKNIFITLPRNAQIVLSQAFIHQCQTRGPLQPLTWSHDAGWGHR